MRSFLSQITILESINSNSRKVKLAFGHRFPNIFGKYYLGEDLGEISPCVWP